MRIIVFTVGAILASSVFFFGEDKSAAFISDIASATGFNGVLPQKSAKTDKSASASISRFSPSNAGAPYDRSLYKHWTDEDGDCMNTRHETLAALATGPITLSKDGCAVVRGRWNDPYTGQIYMNARDLDVDHMVPLAWAHVRGGAAWSPDQKEAFANDPRNLFAVQASANRQKGAKGPTEWLPPNEPYRCEYVLRFTRIVLIYKLSLFPGEAEEINAVRDRMCGTT